MNYNYTKVLEILYQFALLNMPIDASEVWPGEDTGIKEDDIRYAREISKKQKKINKIIDMNLSSSWDLERLHPVDKAILTIAIYQMLVSEKPIKECTQQAVDAAKKYSSDESIKFIQGILSNIGRKINFFRHEGK